MWIWHVFPLKRENEWNELISFVECNSRDDYENTRKFMIKAHKVNRRVWLNSTQTINPNETLLRKMYTFIKFNIVIKTNRWNYCAESTVSHSTEYKFTKMKLEWRVLYCVQRAIARECQHESNLILDCHLVTCTLSSAFSCSTLYRVGCIHKCHSHYKWNMNTGALYKSKCRF